jgi:hypothetical protein
MQRIINVIAVVTITNSSNVISAGISTARTYWIVAPILVAVSVANARPF